MSKDVSERVRECILMRQKLKLLDMERLDSIKVLIEKMNEFVKGGGSETGRIRIVEIGKTLEYRFVATAGKESALILKGKR